MPDTQKFFERVDGDDLTSPKFIAHSQRVLGGLDMCVALLDDTPTLTAQLNYLQQAHIERGITADYFLVSYYQIFTYQFINNVKYISLSALGSNATLYINQMNEWPVNSWFDISFTSYICMYGITLEVAYVQDVLSSVSKWDSLSLTTLKMNLIQQSMRYLHLTQ